MTFHAVEISFPLRYQPPLWRHKPASFLGHFVGHEGPGSLHSYLKKKGWITSLNAGAQNLARGIAMFKATCHLTKEGFSESILMISIRVKSYSPLSQKITKL
jgi:insulysin